MLISKYQSTSSIDSWVKKVPIGKEFTATATEKMHGTNASIIIQPDNKVVLMGRSRIVDENSTGLEKKIYNTLSSILDDVLKFDKKIRKYHGLDDKTLRYPFEIFGDGIAKKYFYDNVEDIQGEVIKPSKSSYSMESLSGFPQIAIFFNFILIYDDMNDSWNTKIKSHLVLQNKEVGLYPAKVVMNKFKFYPNRINYKKFINDFELKPSPFMFDNFGVKMIPEGVVFNIEDMDGNLSLFKLKGLKHCKSYRKNKTGVFEKGRKTKEVIFTKSEQHFIEVATSSWRFKQFIDEIENEIGDKVSMANIGDYLKRVMKDINKECSFMLDDYKPKRYNSVLIRSAKEYFMDYLLDGE